MGTKENQYEREIVGLNFSVGHFPLFALNFVIYSCVCVCVCVCFFQISSLYSDTIIFPRHSTYGFFWTLYTSYTGCGTKSNFTYEV